MLAKGDIEPKTKRRRGEKDADDIEVFEVMNLVAVRRSLSVVVEGNSTGINLLPRQVVSGTVRVANGHAFLDLQSRQGFVPLVAANGVLCLRWLPVQHGLCLYRVNNGGAGIALRKFPDHSQEARIIPEEIIPHNSLVTGNARVRGEHGDVFVRVLTPSGIEGWLFETRDAQQVLAPEPFQNIEVFEVLFPVDVRRSMLIKKEGNLTGTTLAPKRIVSGIINLADSQQYLRLESKEGFVPLAAPDGTVLLRWIPVQKGLCIYRVNNGPAGMALRFFPDHAPEVRLIPEKIFGPDALVTGEARVRGENGDIFVRTITSSGGGWLFETRGGEHTLLPLEFSPPPPLVEKSIPVPPEPLEAPLNLNAVRDIAKRYKYVEVEHNRECRVVSFLRVPERINVFYSTGTVGICMDHPRQERIQVFRRGVSVAALKDIFENPRNSPLLLPAATVMKGGAAGGAPFKVSALPWQEISTDTDGQISSESKEVQKEIIRVEAEALALTAQHNELLVHLRSLNEASDRRKAFAISQKEAAQRRSERAAAERIAAERAAAERIAAERAAADRMVAEMRHQEEMERQRLVAQMGWAPGARLPF